MPYVTAAYTLYCSFSSVVDLSSFHPFSVCLISYIAKDWYDNPFVTSVIDFCSWNFNFLFLPYRCTKQFLVMVMLFPLVAAGNLVMFGGGLCIVFEIFPGEVDSRTSGCDDTSVTSLSPFYTPAAFSGIQRVFSHFNVFKLMYCIQFWLLFYYDFFVESDKHWFIRLKKTNFTITDCCKTFVYLLKWSSFSRQHLHCTTTWSAMLCSTFVVPRRPRKITLLLLCQFSGWWVLVFLVSQTLV